MNIETMIKTVQDLGYKIDEAQPKPGHVKLKHFFLPLSPKAVICLRDGWYGRPGHRPKLRSLHGSVSILSGEDVNKLLDQALA